MVSLVSQNDVLTAIGRARNIIVTAYILGSGAVYNAVANAAERGAKVTVRLEGSAHVGGGALARLNQPAVDQLHRLGADARLVHTGMTDGPALHMKAVVADGVAFLDDRNFPDRGADTIVRDDSRRDVRSVIGAALQRRGTVGRFFSTDASGALRTQAHLLYDASNAREVEVESESFGVSPQAYFALKKLAMKGVHCRLLVTKRAMNTSARMRRALELLAQAGVQIRVGAADEKLAVVDGAQGWIGSANATMQKPGGQIDWGLRTNDCAIVRGLDAHFQRNWRHSKPLPKCHGEVSGCHPEESKGRPGIEARTAPLRHRFAAEPRFDTYHDT